MIHQRKLPKANWLTVKDAKRIRTAHDDRQTGVSGSHRFKFRQRKPLRPMSRKRRAESQQYKVKRMLFLAEHPKCERPGCNALSVCIHHRFGRGVNFLDVSTWSASCLSCNSWAKDHPTEARAIGWICEQGQWETKQG
jgi:hypothetical protein